VTTTRDQTVAAGHSVAPARWQAGLEELLGRVAGRFGRVEPRRRARAFVLGLLADLPRKNCWTIAEHAGNPNPDGMQHLLARALWDEDKVRDDVRDYLVEHLGDPKAVLVIDETGDLKKGAGTVGVQRQYTGTAGRVENAQVAVYMVYATAAGHALIDRDLYLPGAGPTIPRAARRRPGGVGCRRRGLRRRPQTAGRAAGPRRRLRAGGRLRPPRQLRRRLSPCRHPAKAGPGEGVAAGVVRQGRQRPPLLRLGVHPPGPPRPGFPRPGGPVLAHDPPQPADRRAGLLPLLDAWPRPTGHPGPRRRGEVDGGGAISDRQGPGRPGPAPGPPLAVLVPVGHPCHARPRLPGGRRRDRAHLPAAIARADPVDLQRGPAPVRDPGRPSHQ